MATRYQVEWIENGDTPISRGFAFQTNALDLWARLVASERSDVGSGITGATLRFLGPNGERHEELEVSSTFSKGGGGMGGGALP